LTKALKGRIEREYATEKYCDMLLCRPLLVDPGRGSGAVLPNERKGNSTLLQGGAGRMLRE